ncbi:MAG: hypothetical protein JO249_23285 [Acidobacteria bacterium]|nr:hypothetical protein [Acidobacteriota bacterium]
MHTLLGEQTPTPGQPADFPPCGLGERNQLLGNILPLTVTPSPNVCGSLSEQVAVLSREYNYVNGADGMRI